MSALSPTIYIVRKFLVLLLALLLTFSLESVVFAQSTSPSFRDSATTIVGSAEPYPSGYFPPPIAAPGGSASVAYWADYMAERLEKNDTTGTYTRLPSPITNTENGVTIGAGRYVCTGLVIASSKLAGESVPRKSYVLDMQHDWEAVTGHALLNYTQNNRNIALVRPGDAFFQLTGPGDYKYGYARPSHVSIVYAINIDENGDGVMITREANAPRISIEIRFQNWQMRSFDWSGFNVFLFGLRK